MMGFKIFTNSPFEIDFYTEVNFVKLSESSASKNQLLFNWKDQKIKLEIKKIAPSLQERFFNLHYDVLRFARRPTKPAKAENINQAEAGTGTVVVVNVPPAR